MKRSALARTGIRVVTIKEPAELTAARHAVMARSLRWCEVRFEGCTTTATEVHHRKLRRHGDHRPVNLLAVCAPCHARVHARPEESYLAGLLVKSYRDPAEVPVEHLFGVDGPVAS